MLLARAILQIFEITSLGISSISRKSLNLILTANRRTWPFPKSMNKKGTFKILKNIDLAI